MRQTHCLALDLLQPFLDRHRKKEVEVMDFNFHDVLKKVVDELGEMVPSEGIFVLLDDPQQVSEEGPKNLVYVAGCGEKAQQLMGLKTISNQGLISQVYKTGVAFSVTPSKNETAVVDKIHLPKEVKDVVCAPLKIANSTLGVVVVFGKQDPMGFSLKDIRMVHLFTGYLAMYIQSAMDSKKNKELTKRDNLTGLYNDRYFHSQLEKEVFSAHRNGSELVLMFLDLDNFKSVNDRYGHIVGSQTLKEVGFVLREIVQVPNATLARYGGDEYCCILPGITIEDAVSISNALNHKITDKMFMVDSGDEDGSFISFKGVISASIGLASLQVHTGHALDNKERKNILVRLADRAMYDAKEMGKNCVCVSKGAAVLE